MNPVLQAGRPPRLPETVTRFQLDERPEPGYLALWRTGELQRRAAAALAELESCHVCPRDCGVDRLSAVAAAEDQGRIWEPVLTAGRAPKRSGTAHIPKGTACFTGRHARVSTSFPHFGEEDALRGWRGSGTIFFGFCNLRCVFCQNWDTSQAGHGRELSAPELAGRMLELQARGCHNINLVTPEHVVPQALEALVLAAERGLNLPLIYNTSAYDSLASLRLMDGIVDIYMPDFKAWDAAVSKSLLKAEDYPEVARAAVREMHRQVGPLTFDSDGLAVRGVLVRHLLMPGHVDEAGGIFGYLAESLSPDTWVNLMDQYYPSGSVGADAAVGARHPELGRGLSESELARGFALAREAGLWRLDTRWRPAA